MGEFNVNKSNGSLEQTAGMPSEYPASQVMMSDGVTSVEDRIAPNTISHSTREALTFETNYTAPCDGYFRIQCDSGNYKVSGMVSGENAFTAFGNSGDAGFNMLFVRKGTVIQYTGSSGHCYGHFYPLN